MQKNPSTYQPTINHSLSRIFFGLKQRTWLGIFISIGISLILATRNIYIAIDDDNYIAYFEFIDFGFANINNDWWNFVLDESLWGWYSSSMGKIFGAERALRITIFISSLMFIVASGSLTRGAWIFIFLVFVIDSTLATQMYFNQIRQGFALSIFFTIIAVGLSPFLGCGSGGNGSFLFSSRYTLLSNIIDYQKIQC